MIVAAMSRPVAGVRNKTLIVTVPGSPKGAKENLQAIIKLLPHGCVQAAGANSRQIHAGGVEKLEKDAGLRGSRSDPPQSVIGDNKPGSSADTTQSLVHSEWLMVLWKSCAN